MPEVEEIVLSLQRGKEEGAELIVHLHSHTHQLLYHTSLASGSRR